VFKRTLRERQPITQAVAQVETTVRLAQVVTVAVRTAARRQRVIKLHHREQTTQVAVEAAAVLATGQAAM